MLKIGSFIIVFITIYSSTFAQRNKYTNIQKSYLKLIYGNYSEEIKRSTWECKDPEILNSIGIKKESEKLLSRVFFIDSLPKNKIYVFTQSAPDNFNCHSCSPIISISVFLKLKDSLIYEFTDNFEVLGSYGFAPDIDLINLNNNSYSFIIKTGYTAQGYNVESTKIYLLSNKRVMKVLDLPDSYQDNSGICIESKANCWKYKSIISVVPTVNFADIIVKKSGSREIKDKIVKFDSVYIYKYYLGKYIIK